MHLIDGTDVQADIIVWATGYPSCDPVLGAVLAHRQRGEHAAVQAGDPHRDPSLTFVGLMQSTGAAMPVVEAQSKLAAAYFAGEYALPSKNRIDRAITKALQ